MSTCNITPVIPVATQFCKIRNLPFREQKHGAFSLGFNSKLNRGLVQLPKYSDLINKKCNEILHTP
jgi:hypothetical protein